MISDEKDKNDSNMSKICFTDGILAKKDVIDHKTISHA